MSDDPQHVPPIPERKWTVLLYMAGDNNLSEECVYALTEIKEALPREYQKQAVLAQFDPSGVRTSTKRYLLRSNGTPQQPGTTLEEDAEETGWRARETDTGEPHNLLEFIRWGISQYPAEFFMVVLVGHGSGTDDDFMLRDENPPNSLSISELHDVFTQVTNDGHKIAILGMDTCLMNMAEVCYELKRTSITYLIGSEGFSPNTGWPYKVIFEKLVHKIATDARNAKPDWLAKLIVDEYKKFYEPYINGGISVDQSVLEVAKIDELKTSFAELIDSLLLEVQNKELDYLTPKQNALVLAHWDTQSYNGEVFIDLFDFCERLELRYKPIDPRGKVVQNCVKVKQAIDKVVLRSCVAGAAFQFSYGLSMYFPWAVLSPRYGNLAFPKETKWLDFLDKYHLKTRRPGRDDETLKDTTPPFRASVPVNKGRDGRIESMRNPPIKEFKGCASLKASNGDGSPERQGKNSAPRKKKAAPGKKKK